MSILSTTDTVAMSSSDNSTSTPSLSSSRSLSFPPSSESIGAEAIALVSIFFGAVAIVGIVGNASVVFIVLGDSKMRRSATNMFIMNLAAADLLVMLFGIPEMVLFVINRGWLLGHAVCRVQRYTLVFGLYASVFTLVSVCVERYIAIVHPMKAHILCSRRRMALVIAGIWPCSLLLALPVLLYNRLKLVVNYGSNNSSIQYCKLIFPGDTDTVPLQFVIFKYAEFIMFYFCPLLIQGACYTVIGRQLFAGADQLHRKTLQLAEGGGTPKQRCSDALNARKGVVKMLIVSVTIYFLSYSPHQLLLFYNTFSQAPFHQTWIYFVIVTSMGYVNSAANPVLYCIFSQAFRGKFRQVFWRCCCQGAADMTAAGGRQSGREVPLRYYSSVNETGVTRGGSTKYHHLYQQMNNRRSEYKL